MEAIDSTSSVLFSAMKLFPLNVKIISNWHVHMRMARGKEATPTTVRAVRVSSPPPSPLITIIIESLESSAACSILTSAAASAPQ
jgi:hypothetical protein